MAVSEGDARVLASFAAAKEAYPELGPLLNFYEAIHRTQFEAKAVLSDREVEIAPEPLRRERLEKGEIQLTFEQFHLDRPVFSRLVREMSYIILENSPGWKVPSEPVEMAVLTDMARRWFESGEPVAGNGPPTTLVALAVGFALSTYLQRAAEQLHTLLDREQWRRKVCPVCGGKPGFATLARADGSRSLFCPRCHDVWPFRRTACPFCENEEGVVYYPSEDGVYRLYVCPKCRRYLKTKDLRRTDSELILPLERVITVDLDLTAQEEGYLYC